METPGRPQGSNAPGDGDGADAAPMPPPSSAPRPPTGPTTAGVPGGRTTEPIAVGDPTGGTTAQASITTPPRPAPPTDDGDWPAQATDAIVNVVGKVRDRTTGPITKAARAAVFGLFIGVIGLMVAVLALIAVIRLLDEALPSGVWLPYLILGAIFVIAGGVLFSRRHPPAASGNTAHR